MRVTAVEEMVMNKESHVYGWRSFRLEYGGHAEACIIEGRIWIPPEKVKDAYKIIDAIEELFK